MISKQTHTFKVVGNCEIQADVYGVFDHAKRPVIMFIHGGALIMGHRENINHEHLEMYVNAGYNLVSVDYRLAPETKLKAIIEDVQDAYSWIYEMGPKLFSIDPDRISVIGHSAGGYLTLMTGFCVEPHPKALISFYGYGDVIASWYSQPDPFYCQQPPVSKEDTYNSVGDTVISGTSGPNNRYLFYLYCRQHGIWPKEVAGYDPDTEPTAFTPFCPVRNVTIDYPPTLLLHGDKDTDVPYEQSVMMANELARVGVEHELITIPNGGHGFEGVGLKDTLVSKAFERILSFLEDHNI